MLGSTPVRFRRLSSEFKKYRRICNEEGIQGLSWCVINFLHKTRKAFFSIEKFYVYEMALSPDIEIPLLTSKVEGLRVKPIFLPISLQEYEYLGNEGVDFEKLMGAKDYQSDMNNGTIIFLTYKKETLINRTGMTLYKNGVYQYCCPLENKSTGTVYAGFSETTKTARKLGVYSFIHSYIFNYLKEMGFKKVELLESEDQPGPRKVQDKLGAKITHTTTCIRLLLFFIYWTTPKKT